MVSSRVAASLAVLVGGTLGTTAALLAHPVPPRPGGSGSATSTRVAKPSGLVAARGMLNATGAPAATAHAGVQGAQSAAGGARSEAIVTPRDAQAVWQSELRCARLHVSDCLRAADAYEAGDGVEPDRHKANIYANQARRLWERACMQRRDPEACVRLSEIYRQGRGTLKNSHAARGLVMRARELCEVKHSAFCEELGDEAAP